MALKTWQFATIMLVALAMAAAVCHFMELPGKMEYDAPLYVMLHRTLYPTFGQTAGIAEALGVISSVVLVWRVRQQRAFRPTLIGAILMVIAHVVFWTIVQPANEMMASWPLEKIPIDWTRWRNQWEYAHASRAVLIIGALAALVISILRDPAASRSKS